MWAAGAGEMEGIRPVGKVWSGSIKPGGGGSWQPGGGPSAAWKAMQAMSGMQEAAPWGKANTVPKKNKSNQPFQRAFVESPEEQEPGVYDDMRASMEITVEGAEGQAFAPLFAFEELEVVPNYAHQALRDQEFQTPMPIQAQALPIILAGHDLIGIARTGSGKTLAYLLPAIVHIEAQRPLDRSMIAPIGLVLAPTRELAVQISEEADKLLKNSKEGNHKGGMWACVVYGGKQKAEQVRNLWKGCHILVATPGRLMDLMNSGEVSLERVTYFVLDEADRMLDFGFQDDVNKIASAVRPDRHMLFFSATWPKEVQELAKTLCKDGQQPVRISVGQHEDGVAATRTDITQEVVVFDQETWEERDAAKQTHLYAHLRSVLQSEDNKILVFVNSKVMADEMRNKLWEEGFKTESMHGGRAQQQRLDVLDGFRKGETRLLVATDVMGRGLDIPDITHVVIYDMGAVDDYIHRIGRTARGLADVRGGHALTLFEYNHKWPEIAGGLIQVLIESGSVVPHELQMIADQVASGTRQVSERGFGGGKKRKWKEYENGNAEESWSEGMMMGMQMAAQMMGMDISEMDMSQMSQMAKMSKAGGGGWKAQGGPKKECKWCQLGECWTHGQA